MPSAPRWVVLLLLVTGPAAPCAAQFGWDEPSEKKAKEKDDAQAPLANPAKVDRSHLRVGVTFVTRSELNGVKLEVRRTITKLTRRSVSCEEVTTLEVPGKAPQVSRVKVESPLTPNERRPQDRVVGRETPRISGLAFPCEVRQMGDHKVWVSNKWPFEIKREQKRGTSALTEIWAPSLTPDRSHLEVGHRFVSVYQYPGRSGLHTRQLRTITKITPDRVECQDHTIASASQGDQPSSVVGSSSSLAPPRWEIGAKVLGKETLRIGGVAFDCTIVRKNRARVWIAGRWPFVIRELSDEGGVVTRELVAIQAPAPRDVDVSHVEVGQTYVFKPWVEESTTKQTSWVITQVTPKAIHYKALTKESSDEMTSVESERRTYELVAPGGGIDPARKSEVVGKEVLTIGGIAFPCEVRAYRGTKEWVSRKWPGTIKTSGGDTPVLVLIAIEQPKAGSVTKPDVEAKPDPKAKTPSSGVQVGQRYHYRFRKEGEVVVITSETVQEITSVTSSAVEVKVVTTTKIEMKGVDAPTLPPTVTKSTMRIPLLSDGARKAAPAEGAKLIGSETIGVRGEPFECQIYESKHAKIWVSKTFPYTIKSVAQDGSVYELVYIDSGD